MSPPTQASLKGIDLTLLNEAERLDAFLSAARRRHQADALAELDRWRPLHSFERRGGDVYELSKWVGAECRLHVEGGRFEHAIALVERYRRQPHLPFKGDARPTTGEAAL